MSQLPEYIDGLPVICGSESLVEDTMRAGRDQPVFLPESRVDFDASARLAPSPCTCTNR